MARSLPPPSSHRLASYDDDDDGRCEELFNSSYINKKREKRMLVRCFQKLGKAFRRSRVNFVFSHL